jgi:hypothetical protein
MNDNATMTMAAIRRRKAAGFSIQAIADEFGLTLDEVFGVLRPEKEKYRMTGAASEADMVVAVGRRLLANPPQDLVERVFGGSVERFRECVRCNFGAV